MANDGGAGVVTLLDALRGWPRRRWLAAGVATVPMSLLNLWDGSSTAIGWSVPVAVLLGATAALVLASYLPMPGSGRWLDVGCTPCSTVAVVTVVGAFLFRDTAPLDPGLNVVAGLLLLFGLGQRLNGGACAVRPGPADQGVAAPTE